MATTVATGIRSPRMQGWPPDPEAHLTATPLVTSFQVPGAA